MPRFRPDIADKHEALTIRIKPISCARRVGAPPSPTSQAAPLILKSPDAN